MPNIVAQLSLIIWPVLTLLFFVRMPIAPAMIVSIIGGYLFLPVDVAYDFPLIPPLNKDSITAISVAFAVVFIRKKSLIMVGPSFLAGVMLIMGIFIGPIFTVLNNDQPLLGGRVAGLEPKEIVSMIISTFLMVLPFFLGRQFLRTTKDQRYLLIGIVVFGLVYSLLVLWEVRMSPQLNRQIYGFFPHDWAQQKRMGGFRAVVFLGHGLYVAFFMATVFIGAAALWRTKWHWFKRGGLALSGFLLAVLLLCKTVSAAMYGILMFPVARFFNKRNQLRIAVLMALLVCTYPLLRTAQLIPTEEIVTFFQGYSADRAGSLDFRFENEDNLIIKAMDKPFFGWGSYGRNRVYDLATGADLSTVDGMWIIYLGEGGLVKYLCIFGLLGYSIWRVRAVSKGKQIEQVPFETCCLCLILGVNMVDLLPNSSLSPLTWLIAGALLGWSENYSRELIKQRREAREAARQNPTVAPA